MELTYLQRRTEGPCVARVCGGILKSDPREAAFQCFDEGQWPWLGVMSVSAASSAYPAMVV